MRARHALIVLVSLAGCAGPAGLSRTLQNYTSLGQFGAAAEFVEKSKGAYGPKNALLFYMDKGLLLHLDGRYEASNAAFEAAKKTADDLFTRSVKAEASTWLVSDNQRPYYGEDFERGMLHVFSALNYVQLRRPAEALVEARQVNAFLAKRKTDGGPGVSDDAFARWMMGFFYEDAGDLNNAFISYHKAIKAYGASRKTLGLTAPTSLVADTLRSARALGFEDRVREIQKDWNVAVPAPRPSDAGEVVVVAYNGLAPLKVSRTLEIGVVAGWPYVENQAVEGEAAQQVEEARSIVRSLVASDIVKVAYPVFIDTPYAARGLSILANDATEAHVAETAQDVGALAVANLDARWLAVRGKAIARAVIKYVLSKKVGEAVEKKRGEGAGFLAKALLQAVAGATETADRRSWSTLPDQILLGRVVLPAGQRRLTLHHTDAQGATLFSEERDVTVPAGGRTYVLVRTAQ